MRFNNSTNKQFNFSIILLLILIITISSCERDDICIDEITPKLVLRFYDNDEQTVAKNVENIKVQIIGIDTIYAYSNETITSFTDSITIPLKVTDAKTQFILTSNNTDDVLISIDTLTLDYTLEEVFVGRSCGFKSIFNDVEYRHTVNWIKNIEVITDTITNETSAHVKIFH